MSNENLIEPVGVGHSADRKQSLKDAWNHSVSSSQQPENPKKSPNFKPRVSQGTNSQI
jgi:hypothetical protein